MLCESFVVLKKDAKHRLERGGGRGRWWILISMQHPDRFQQKKLSISIFQEDTYPKFVSLGSRLKLLKNLGFPTLNFMSYIELCCTNPKWGRATRNALTFTKNATMRAV